MEVNTNVKHTKKPLPLTIVIPAYNEEKNIQACLNAISDQEIMPDRVIVVDNNSSDKTVAIASRYDFVEIVHESRQGIAYARNAGFDAVHAGIIARIDADTTIPDTWVRDVVNFYKDEKHFGSVLTGTGHFSNLLFPPKAVTRTVQSLIAFRFNRMIMGHYILWGSNMAMLTEHWKRVRNEVCKDNDIHEDLDLAIHLNRLGVDIFYDPKLHVGVVMKRVLDDYSKLYDNLMWWPRTLKRHDNKRWILGTAGAYFLLVNSTYIYLINKSLWYVVGLRKQRHIASLAKVFSYKI